jgi:hypothetical protein
MRRERLREIVWCVVIVIAACLLLLLCLPAKSAEQGQPATCAGWCGAYQIVYAADPDTGVARKFERREVYETTNGGRPNTGKFGPWRETYCEVPGAPSYSYKESELPKTSHEEIARCIGAAAWHWFVSNPSAGGNSGYLNLTTLPFSENHLQLGLRLSTGEPMPKKEAKPPRLVENTFALDQATGRFVLFHFGGKRELGEKPDIDPRQQQQQPPPDYKPPVQLPPGRQCRACGGDGVMAHPDSGNGPIRWVKCYECGGTGKAK